MALNPTLEKLLAKASPVKGEAEQCGIIPLQPVEITWQDRAIYAVAERLSKATTGPAIDALDLAEELVEIMQGIKADFAAAN